MMREILFRGKRVDNGEWVYGDLLRARGYVNRIEYTVIFTDPAEFPKGEYFGAVHIIPETMGQYTGMTDKNGKRIFEGDIVISKHPRRLSNKPFIVTYKPIVGGYGYWKLDIHEQLEVVGNIHDNPELIAEVEG